MKIIQARLEDIKPYKKNPRFNDEAVEKVAESIKNFGFRNPIIVDKNNEIIAGHTRVKAAELLGLETVPIIKASDLTPEQVKAYRIADNKTAEFSEWDLDLLSDEMEELRLLGLELEKTGFSTEEIEQILSHQDEGTEVIDDDFIVEVPEEPKSQRGDIWELGEHRLMCGDSLDTRDIEILTQGEVMDLIITDPPYNVAYEGQKGMTIQNDDMAEAEFEEFISTAYKRMRDCLKPGGPIYVFHADSSGEIFRNEMKNSGLELKQVLIWVKDQFVMGRQDYHWRHEPILYGWKGGAAHKWYGDRNKDTVIESNERRKMTQTSLNKLNKAELVQLIRQLQEDIAAIEEQAHTTIIRENRPISSDLHPTTKPLPLIGRLMKNSSLKGDKVLDLFGGSGSTMMAGEQLQRKTYLMEIDEGYTDVIVKRYVRLTGRADKVTLIRNGERISYKEIMEEKE